MKLFYFPRVCFTVLLHMCKPRVVDLVSATPLFVHLSVVLGISFPFYFKMHDITLHIGLNPNSASKMITGCVYLR